MYSKKPRSVLSISKRWILTGIPSILYIRIKTENSELDTFCSSVNSVMDNQFCY